MPYITPDLNYYAVGDDVAEGSVKVAVRPTREHVLTDNWLDDPLDPAVCWRTKTAAEIDAEKTARAELFDNPKRGARAQAWVNYQFIKDPTLYATPLAYWKAIKIAYRNRPWKQ